ncbi:MAG TPA: hypothetical protein VK480_06690, partial [Solirubrobacterales bacterium]|nr:hypothetical protein [Solirubrobacterales bacterium]
MAEPVVGCVYIPSARGFRLWRDWDPGAVAADLARVRAEGLEAVRFFVLWRDFEPAPGRYDERAFEHLRAFVEEAGRQRLLCLPAVLTVFVNGELLDLPWRAGRDLWRDAEMRERARAFAAAVAATLRGCDNVFAYDLGDELVHLDLGACERLGREEAERWQRELAAAIRAEHPGVPVLQGCDASAVFGAHPFGADNAAALDLIGVHSFPNWAPVPLDGVADPRASLLPGFLVRFARAFGRPLADELGSYGASAELSAGHLRAAGASALAAGAAGLFAWCWQDIADESAPYDRRPHEREAGLVDAAGRAKPGLGSCRGLVSLAGLLAGAKEAPAPIGVLVPDRKGAGARNYLAGEEASAAKAAFGAYVILTQEKLPVEFVLAPGAATRLLVCPDPARLSLSQARALEAFVGAGGHLWLTNSTPLAIDAIAGLTGAAPRDFTIDRSGRGRLRAGGEELALDWEACGRPPASPVWELRDAEPVARFEDGSAAIWTRQRGGGRVWTAQLPLELQPLSREAATRDARWGALYMEAAAAAGVAPVARCEAPWLQLQARERDGERRLLAINHAASAVTTTVELAGDGFELSLPAKDFSWLSR